MSAMVPPARVIDKLHRLFARFLWGNATSSKNKHWVAWDSMCYPRKEGDLGFRSLNDMSRSLLAKLWWKLRTKSSSLLGAYL